MDKKRQQDKTKREKRNEKKTRKEAKRIETKRIQDVTSQDKTKHDRTRVDKTRQTIQYNRHEKIREKKKGNNKVTVRQCESGSRPKTQTLTQTIF
jgi:hypothetical protein